METLLDRCRCNTIELLESSDRIIAAWESGMMICSAEEIARLKALAAEHERLLKLRAGE